MNRNEDFSLTTRQGHIPHVPITWGCCPRFPSLLQGMSCLMSCKVITCYTWHGCTFRGAPLHLPQKLVFVSVPAQREREHTVPSCCNRSYSWRNPVWYAQIFSKKVISLICLLPITPNDTKGHFMSPCCRQTIGQLFLLLFFTFLLFQGLFSAEEHVSQTLDHGTQAVSILKMVEKEIPTFQGHMHGDSRWPLSPNNQ